MTPDDRISLSFRTDKVGGEVRDTPVFITPEGDESDHAQQTADERKLANAQHLVLLIHGYNNDQADARKAFEGFYACQNDLDTNKRYSIGRTFVDVYWPGDAAWCSWMGSSVRRFASALFYMKSIGNAIQSAENLANYLAGKIHHATRIDIVAHSMGCRLSLELLRALQSRSISLCVERIIFMAGAIPTFMLKQSKPSQRLRPSYDHILKIGTRSIYSSADLVLAIAFPAGQSLAKGPEGFLPTALGHSLWKDTTAPFNLGQTEISQAGHSDYWGWNRKPGPLERARRANQITRHYLQFPSAGRRENTKRFYRENTVLDARAASNARSIPKRKV